MRTGELCVREVSMATRDEAVGAVTRRMLERATGVVVVVDDERTPRPVGIATERDMLRALADAEARPASAWVVGEVMSRDLLVAREDEEVLDALRRMRVRGVRRLPVVRVDGTLAGLLTFDDVVDWLAEELTELARLMKNERRRERARARG